MCIYIVYMYIYVYIYIYICTVYIYIYIYVCMKVKLDRHSKDWRNCPDNDYRNYVGLGCGPRKMIWYNSCPHVLQGCNCLETYCVRYCKVYIQQTGSIHIFKQQQWGLRQYTNGKSQIPLQTPNSRWLVNNHIYIYINTHMYTVSLYIYIYV